VGDSNRPTRRSLGEITLRDCGLHSGYRSLLLWCRKFDTGGEAALADNYVSNPPKCLTLSASVAAEAVKLCCWWSFRIGNCELIDHKMVHAAAALLSRGFPLADVVAVIDCYYGYDADRASFPFKPFARWCKYDFDKWLLRAAASADHMHRLSDPSRARQQAVSPHLRRRESRNFATRSAIARESPPPAGCPIASAVGDSIVDGQRSLAECLAALPDAYRCMLIRAARGEKHANSEAVATIALWWPQLPEDVRRPIDAKADRFRAGLPQVRLLESAVGDDRNRLADMLDLAVAQRRLDLLAPLIRDARRSGSAYLRVAARMAR
jgi:hypothetical protein